MIASLQILRFRVLILLAEEVTGVAGSLAVFFLAEEGIAAFFGVSSTSFGSRVRDVLAAADRPSVSVEDCLLTGIITVRNYNITLYVTVVTNLRPKTLIPWARRKGQKVIYYF